MSAVLEIRPSKTTKETFMEIYGGIYEHSPWIAEAAWHSKNGENLDTANALHHAMRSAVDTADETARLRLICAHPDLAGKAAVRGELTNESRSEQKGAGLDACSPQEFEEFQILNKAYRQKFGFPFIIAVKGHDRHSILASFRTRLNHDRAVEFETALTQIHKIASLRLADLCS